MGPTGRTSITKKTGSKTNTTSRILRRSIHKIYSLRKYDPLKPRITESLQFQSSRKTYENSSKSGLRLRKSDVESGIGQAKSFKRSRRIVLSRQPWSIVEDSAVTKLVKEHGTTKWSLIAIMMREKYGMQGRTGKQCRER